MDAAPGVPIKLMAANPHKILEIFEKRRMTIHSRNIQPRIESAKSKLTGL
ncbi:MAG: hypothetical protein ABJP02_08405 [Parasphingorhabdus sp.]